MNNAIARTEQTSLTPIDGGMSMWRQMREEADVLVKSGFFPVDTAEKALAIIMLGRELGLGPMQSMRMIDVIKGKPCINSNGMAALVQKYCVSHGGYLRTAALDDDRCTIEYKRPEWSEPQRFTFTMDDAEAAKLLGNDSWKKYPRNMLYARATSNACRMGWPEVIAGIYDPDELGGAVYVQEPPTDRMWATAVSEREDVAALEAETVNEDTGEIIDHDAIDRERAMKRYFAVLHERGITDDERGALQRIWPGVESAKEMTAEQIRKLTERIEANTSDKLRQMIAEAAQKRASASKPLNMNADTFDAESATQQLLAELQAATTQDEVQAIGRSAAAMGLHSPELAKATAEAFLKFRTDDAILDTDKPLKLA